MYCNTNYNKIADSGKCQLRNFQNYVNEANFCQLHQLPIAKCPIIFSLLFDLPPSASGPRSSPRNDQPQPTDFFKKMTI